MCSSKREASILCYCIHWLVERIKFISRIEQRVVIVGEMVATCWVLSSEYKRWQVANWLPLSPSNPWLFFKRLDDKEYRTHLFLKVRVYRMLFIFFYFHQQHADGIYLWRKIIWNCRKKGLVLRRVSLPCQPYSTTQFRVYLKTHLKAHWKEL